MNYTNYNQLKTLQEKINKLYVCKSGDTMTGNLNMSCNNIINIQDISLCNGGNILMNCGNIRTINSITFCDPVNLNNNVMLFSDISSIIQNTYLPSINNQPVSLSRMSIFYNDVSYTVPGGGDVTISFGNEIVNQLNLSISGNIISPSIDISGQYVELYADIQINTIANNTDFSFDISGIDCNFFEIIDSRSVSKKNNVFYLTFGPHIFLPQQWANCSQFVFKLVENVGNSFNVILTKIVFKSYYL